MILHQQAEAVLKELSAVEAAERLNVHPRTVSRWAEQGLLKGAYKKNPLLKNSPYVIPEEAILNIERLQGKIEGKEE